MTETEPAHVVKAFGVPLTPDDAHRFLAQFPNAQVCPICTCNFWELLFTPGDGRYVALDVAPGGTDNMPVFLTACTTCGYARTFMLATLADWKRRQQEADDAGH